MDSSQQGVEEQDGQDNYCSRTHLVASQKRGARELARPARNNCQETLSTILLTCFFDYFCCLFSPAQKLWEFKCWLDTFDDSVGFSIWPLFAGPLFSEAGELPQYWKKLPLNSQKLSKTFLSIFGLFYQSLDMWDLSNVCLMQKKDYSEQLSENWGVLGAALRLVSDDLSHEKTNPGSNSRSDSQNWLEAAYIVAHVCGHPLSHYTVSQQTSWCGIALHRPGGSCLPCHASTARGVARQAASQKMSPYNGCSRYTCAPSGTLHNYGCIKELHLSPNFGRIILWGMVPEHQTCSHTELTCDSLVWPLALQIKG